MPAAKTIRDVLAEEHEAIRQISVPQNASVEDIHRQRNDSDYAALCLSGGGIRSATFNLGLLQGLARARLLESFDYLSTVSGGGFIGSWYSAWKYRDINGSDDLNSPLRRLSDQTPPNSSDIEPKPVEHLRSFGNYLSPRVGLLSADFWMLISVYLRNLCLTNLVFVPVILAVLMIPRIIYSWMNLTPAGWQLADFAMWLLPATGLVTGCYAVTMVGRNLPLIRKRNDDERGYITRCLAPLTISALCLVTYWGWYSQGAWRYVADKPQSFEIVSAHPLAATAVVGFVLLLLPFALSIGSRSIAALGLITAATAVTVGLTYYSLETVLIADTRIYVTFAFPFLFALMMASGTIVAGFTSRHTTDIDEEWWARSGGWMIIVSLGWVAMCALVLWVPEYLLKLVTDVWQNPGALFATWTNMAIAAGPVIGAISMILALLGGFSSTTGAQESGAGTTSSLASQATSVLACIALVFILAALAAFTGPMLVAVSSIGPAPLPRDWMDHSFILANSTLPVVLVTTGILALMAWVFATVIDTNKFSLHYYWRNRIVRAYLGASRDHSKAKRENAFVRFDPDDNVPMHRLRGQRPFHVINIALNLVGSKILRWQERMAESFSVSPLHCGTHWLGYRDSAAYGSPDGISLGTAVALSGAAASPNMGYMMTSPIVRFLMTMFNVRLGAWMGNPGPAGNDTYQDHAPKNIIRPIVAEALGQTDDESPYVYLSDGGHFENLGLYEMVLRRCRFIVVSDASTDPKYTYESLAQAVRKIRVDFGIPIDFEAFPLIGNTPNSAAVHFARGTIGYSKVDPNCKDGCLIYIKPSIRQNEPADIINYLSESGSFPQEPISDQFFSESQFESYRMLGFVIAGRVFTGPDLRAVFKSVGCEHEDSLADRERHSEREPSSTS